MKVYRREASASARRTALSSPPLRALYLSLSAAMLLLSACNRTDNAAVNAESGAQEATTDVHGGHLEHALVAEPPAGERWPTDAPLRTAMTSIRGAVERIVPVYSQGALRAADATALANQVEKDVRYMIENCELEPEADAALHVLIGRMIQAANALRTDPAAEGGVPQLVSVLHDYQATFDHPGWMSIGHADQ